MMNMKNISILASALLSVSATVAGCSNQIEMRYPPKFELPDLPEVEGVHAGRKAPLYWSVYEYCYEKEKQGETTINITPEEWDRIIDWVASDLKPAGYDMICTDGFIAMLSKDETGYMTHYGSISLKDLVAKCEAKGLKLGVYDNPLWIHGPRETPIQGTDYTFANLYWNGTTPVTNASAEDMWFHWVVADAPGAKEYIDGFFRHYSDMGVKFIRMDFLSWYEDGKDRNLGTVGRGYGRAEYGRALAYIAESAKKYGVFTSLVMPHLYNDAEVESKYGNMIRIVADTGNGGWRHCSAQDKGRSYTNWPNCMNMFDGFVYWSHLSGREKVILDGDFIRLNTFDSDDERRTVISLQLMAGGPLAASDQYHNIGDNLKFYTNSELLELNRDGFVGKPLTDKLGDKNNEVWYGQMKNGDYVVGLFNRDDAPRSYSLELSKLGISGEYNARDLWNHTDEGKVTRLDATVPSHGCKIVKLSK